LADGLCPAGRHAPGTVSHLRAAAGVYERHPAGRGAAAHVDEGARRMRSGWQQGACPGRGAPWSRLGIVGHGLIWRREASRVLARSVGLPPTRVWRAYGRRDGAGCAWHKLHSTLEQSVAGRIGGR